MELTISIDFEFPAASGGRGRRACAIEDRSSCKQVTSMSFLDPGCPGAHGAADMICFALKESH